MKGIKYCKAGIALFIIMLLLNSIFVNAKNVKNNDLIDFIDEDEEPNMVKIGYIIIDSTAETNQVDVSIVKHFAKYIHPINDEVSEIVFYADCSILNERQPTYEEWTFKIDIQGYTSSWPDYHETYEVTKYDSVTTGAEEFQISVTALLKRSDFEYFYPRITPKQFQATLYGHYYADHLISDDISYGEDKTWDPYCSAICLENNKPSKPEVSGDISEGELLQRGVSYSLTATSSDDDGDDILFKFYWGDNELDETQFGSDQEATKSHTYNEEDTKIDYTISVYAMDEFHKSSDPTKIHIKLPKSRSIILQNLFIINIFKTRFPLIALLLF